MGCGAVKQEPTHISSEGPEEQEIATSTTAETKRQVSGDGSPERSNDGRHGQETEESAAKAFEQQAKRPSKILTAVVDELEHKDQHGRKISKRTSSRSGSSIRISTKTS
mmetsp:Transcript_107732/g.310186  ORF Transcript_107732/g.310186 Transcript_107732/m.310186 type:complete len:109 (+) Transcript_107732:99-425(+)